MASGACQERRSRAAKIDRLAWCPAIIQEVRKGLLHKAALPVEAVDAEMQTYAAACRLVEPTGAVRGVCRDPKDDMVLECARLAHAAVIVTGDKDLLTLETFEGIPILSPRAYLNLRHQE